jgi:chromosome segregation protein
LNAGVSTLKEAAGRSSRSAHLLSSEAARRLERTRRDRERLLASRKEAERAAAETHSTGVSLREAEETRRAAEAALETASQEAESARAAYGGLNRRLEVLQSAVWEGKNRLSTVSGELERLREVSGRDTESLGLKASGAAELVNRLVAAVRERRNRLRSSRGEVSSARSEVSAERTNLSRRSTGLAGELATLRAETSQLQERLARSEQAAGQAREELSEEWGADLEAARREAEHLPDEETAEAERNRLARNLKRFGDVNLLAISQRDQLAERLEFVAAQRADAEEAARDISRIIQDIDGEIESRFDGTFRRVRDSFRELMPRLMEGSSGELELSEEGVEIGLRLGRRGWRPLHVLSGGERALLALSFLFSVFLSRTQGDTGAFCILDEAEAALDDLNLARFLAVVDSYRASGQFVLVTHQKRTMAAADVLYGVTQDASGATAVVSKRLAGD